MTDQHSAPGHECSMCTPPRQHHPALVATVLLALAVLVVAVALWLI